VLEDIKGLNVFGTLTGIPGEVTVSLGINGVRTNSEDLAATTVIFGVDAARQVHIRVLTGRHLWLIDGKLARLDGNSMFYRRNVTESRALLNGLVCFRWRAVLDTGQRLTLISEEVSVANT